MLIVGRSCLAVCPLWLVETVVRPDEDEVAVYLVAVVHLGLSVLRFG